MKFKLLFVGALCVAPACLAGFDPKNMDTSVKPSVDFYDYAVGTWLKNTKILADHASMGAADIVNDRNQAVLAIPAPFSKRHSVFRPRYGFITLLRGLLKLQRCEPLTSRGK